MILGCVSRIVVEFCLIFLFDKIYIFNFKYYQEQIFINCISFISINRSGTGNFVLRVQYTTPLTETSQHETRVTPRTEIKTVVPLCPTQNQSNLIKSLIKGP